MKQGELWLHAVASSPGLPLDPYPKARGRPGTSYHMSDVTGRREVGRIQLSMGYSATNSLTTICDVSHMMPSCPLFFSGGIAWGRASGT